MSGVEIIPAPGVLDPKTGEVVAFADAPDELICRWLDALADHRRQLQAAALEAADVLLQRHGEGKAHADGWQFTVKQSRTWPVGAVVDALKRLVDEGRITVADANRAAPEKPKPDATQLKALIGRLTVSDPEAAKLLADACTVSPPSVNGVGRS